MERVLIIDPSPMDTKQIKQKFVSTLGCSVTVAGRTSVGVEELKTKRVPAIDFLVVEIDQPDTNDLQVINKLREETDVPMLVLTSELNPTHMFKSLLAGADEYLDKKFFLSADLTTLLLTIQERARIRTSLR